MADVKWITIVTDIFDDEKMCAIESLPDGYMIEVVWLKILCLAGKCNKDGFLMINKKLPYTNEMLSKIFRVDIGVIERALNVFESLEMVELVDNAYMVSNWSKYQNVEGMQKIRDQGKVRQQNYRDRQKQKQIEENVTLRNVTRDVTNNVTNNVTRNVICSISNSIYINNKIDNSKYSDIEEEIVNEEWFYITLDIYPRKDGAETAKMYWLQIMGSVVSGNRKKVALEIYRALELYLDDYLRTHEDEKKRFQYVPSLDKWMKESMNTWIREYNKNRGEEDD